MRFLVVFLVFVLNGCGEPDGPIIINPAPSPLPQPTPEPKPPVDPIPQPTPEPKPPVDPQPSPVPTPEPTPEPKPKGLYCEVGFSYGEGRTHAVYFKAATINDGQIIASIRSVYRNGQAVNEENEVRVIEKDGFKEIESDLFKITFTDESASCLNLSTSETKEMACK